jgi:SAM-dependent methyltransferase
MMRSDEQNLAKVESREGVDRLNGQFYGRFPYPWRPESFHFPVDPTLAGKMLAQDLGDFAHSRPPPRRIWVAGCGTNQAIFLALHYPEAQVTGSDLSVTSLDLCARTAKAMGLGNLELKRETILEAPYREAFDLVVCTGVIHHTGDPPGALAKLGAALKQDGAMELMVYNRFHRILTSAVQKAIQLLAGGARKADIETEIALANELVQSFPAGSLTAQFLAQMKGRPEAMVADTLVQPVEFSYTVESLAAMARDCGLEIVAPCPNNHDKAAGRLSWNMAWSSPKLRDRYEALPDLERWQVTNLLMAEASPMLWFYLQRRDSRFSRRSEREMNEAFLDARFRKTNALQNYYAAQGDGGYAVSSRQVPYSATRRDAVIGRLFDRVDESRTIGEFLREIGVQQPATVAGQARLQLATSGFPFLEAVQSDWI